MDLFTKEPGPLYVPAFAGRLLLAMAKGIARATDRIKGAFMDEDAEGMWTLAMVVVQWYADNLPASESGVVASTLQEFGVAAIASNLNFFRDRLLPFERTAHQGPGPMPRPIHGPIRRRPALHRLRLISAATPRPISRAPGSPGRAITSRRLRASPPCLRQAAESLLLTRFMGG
jgi:hypothetical protein